MDLKTTIFNKIFKMNKRKLGIIIILTIAIILIFFPFIDTNFFYANRIKNRIEILQEITELDISRIKEDNNLLKEYENIIKEINNSDNNYINKILNNNKNDHVLGKFISGGLLWWILGVIMLFFYNIICKENNGKRNIGIRFGGFILCGIIGSFIGFVCSLIPTIFNIWINYIIIPILVLILMTLLLYNKNNQKVGILMKILFATTNQAKILKYKEALEKQGIELLTIKDLDFKLEIDENGKDALENAYIKAKAYFDATKIPTIGMDNTLFIEELPEEQQPGTYVRRVNGKELTDDEMIEYYTNLVKNNGGQLTAKWVYGMVLYNNGKINKLTWAKDHFYFIDKPSKIRNNGYPLDSISIIPEFNKYFVELTPEEKRIISADNETSEIVNFIKNAILQ